MAELNKNCEHTGVYHHNDILLRHSHVLGKNRNKNFKKSPGSMDGLSKNHLYPRTDAT